jgi:hypothetical protein
MAPMAFSHSALLHLPSLLEAHLSHFAAHPLTSPEWQSLSVIHQGPLVFPLHFALNQLVLWLHLSSQKLQKHSPLVAPPSSLSCVLNSLDDNSWRSDIQITAAHKCSASVKHWVSFTASYLQWGKDLGVVVLTCNSNTKERRQEAHKFEASLDYTVRPCLKKKKTYKNKKWGKQKPEASELGASRRVI